MTSKLVKKVIQLSTALFLVGTCFSISARVPMPKYSKPLPKSYDTISSLPERFRNYQKTGKIVGHKIFLKQMIPVIERLEYDTNGDGIGDTRIFYRIQRHILPQCIIIDKPSIYPYMYLFDKSNNGEYEIPELLILLVDPSEDGLNGNEIRGKINVKRNMI